MMKTKEVVIDINEVIDLNLEGFLNLLEELFFADEDQEKRFDYILSDVSYEPVRVEDGLIILAVTGEVIDYTKEDEDE